MSNNNKELFLCGSIVASLMVLKNVSVAEKKDEEMQLNYCAKLTADTKELCLLIAQNDNFADTRTEIERTNSNSNLAATGQKPGNEYTRRLNRAVSSLLIAVRDEAATEESKRSDAFVLAAQQLVACLQEIKRLCYMSEELDVKTDKIALTSSDSLLPDTTVNSPVIQVTLATVNTTTMPTTKSFRTRVSSANSKPRRKSSNTRAAEDPGPAKTHSITNTNDQAANASSIPSLHNRSLTPMKRSDSAPSSPNVRNPNPPSTTTTTNAPNASPPSSQHVPLLPQLSKMQRTLSGNFSPHVPVACAKCHVAVPLSTMTQIKERLCCEACARLILTVIQKVLASPTPSPRDRPLSSSAPDSTSSQSPSVSSTPSSQSSPSMPTRSPPKHDATPPRDIKTSSSAPLLNTNTHSRPDTSPSTPTISQPSPTSTPPSSPPRVTSSKSRVPPLASIPSSPSGSPNSIVSQLLTSPRSSPSQSPSSARKCSLTTCFKCGVTSENLVIVNGKLLCEKCDPYWDFDGL